MHAGGAPRGEVNIEGDSSQNVVGAIVNGNVVQEMNTFVRGRPSMYLGEQQIRERIDCYVPARNHDLIEKTLEVNHAVGLHGPTGCGRETTAITAMRHLHPNIEIRRFSLEDEDTEEIDAKGICGYIVHAADGLSRLPRCLDVVRATGGYLAVIGEAGIDGESAAHVPWMAVEHPDPIEIYRRRLAHHQMEQWLHWEKAVTLLAGALPADAWRLCKIIEDVERGDVGDIEARRTEAANAYLGWADQLHRWFDNHKPAHERVLLVAAAVLSPYAAKSSIYTVASSLAERLEITMDGGGLAWCPVSGLCDLLEATDEDDHVVFHRIGYPGSALQHALADYPLTSNDLLPWLASLPTSSTIPDERRNPLAETFADLAADHAQADPIIETARVWGRDGHADLAFIALSRTCLHPTVGTAIRRALYRWSRSASIPQTLKLTIARVCEPLGQTYPTIALTRLKHLATHGNRQVRGQVVLTALNLAAAGHHTEVLTAALDWCTAANSLPHAARRRRRRAGALLFLELAKAMTASGIPVTLYGHNPTPGWRAALDARTDPSRTPDDAFETVAWLWLDAALHHAQIRELIIDIFIEAARPQELTPHSTKRLTAGPTPDQIMIDTIRQWAAAEPQDPTRKKIKEAIVIPLTHPWWLKLLKIIYVGARDLLTTSRRPR